MSQITRREFATIVAAVGAMSLLPRGSFAESTVHGPIKALVFDAFTIFDARPVAALAEKLFPGHGAELSNEWRMRQFEYTWLRVSARRYADFWRVTGDALDFAVEKLKLELQHADREELMNAFLAMKAWPDVAPALKSLKQSGYRLAFLSNFTPHMLEANVRSAGLDGVFDEKLSTDSAKTFKPDPRAYQLAVDTLQLKREEILFVAFSGWDAAGAKQFGYTTFWNNRQKLPVEKLGAIPDGIGETFAELLKFLEK